MVRSRKWVSHPWDPASVSQEKAMLTMNAANGYIELKCIHDYFDWQYRQNPAGLAAIGLAVDKDDEEILAGNYAVIPLNFCAGGKTFTGALSLNTLTSIDYRGQGLFTSVAKEVFQMAACRGWSIVTGYPNPNSLHGFIKYLGFRDIGQIPLLIRVLSLSGIVEKKMPSAVLQHALKAVARTGDMFFQGVDADDPDVEMLTRFDQDFNQFNDRLEVRFPLFVKRDAAYLNWRYVDAPMDYQCLAIRDRSGILGYIVFRITTLSGMRCGAILDFVVRGDKTSLEAGRRLVRYALGRMTVSGCDIVAALCLPGFSEYLILRKAKFRPCPKVFRPQPFPYIVRGNRPDIDFGIDIYEIHNWFISMGDYDAV